MLGMDGFDFCWVIKIDECSSYILVILLIVLVDQEDVCMGLFIGVDVYLIKFFDVEEFCIWVGQLI